MSESQYVTNIIKEINALGGKAVKFVETEFSEKGTPDIIGCMNCRCFVIETKLASNKLSDIQYQRLKEWQESGSIAFAAVYPNRTAKEVALYVQQLSKTPNPFFMETSNTGN